MQLNCLAQKKRKQVDYDETCTYTDIVSARLTGEVTLDLADFVPNPATDKTVLLATSGKEQVISIAFYNVIGQKVLESRHVLQAGANKIELETTTLANGTYTAVVSSSNQMYTRKLVITR